MLAAIYDYRRALQAVKSQTPGIDSPGIPKVLYGAGPRSLLEANGHRADEKLFLDDGDQGRRAGSPRSAGSLNRALGRTPPHADSPGGARIVVQMAIDNEHRRFLYDADHYGDDLPYWTPASDSAGRAAPRDTVSCPNLLSSRSSTHEASAR